MHGIDWLIASLPVIVCAIIALYTRRYVRSVADFMAGGRHAGRFLVCTAKSEMGAGAVMFVYVFELLSQSGFTVGWWLNLSIPFGLLVAISGFVIYRYRQTRAMTLAQFFEMRYSRKFRLFTGVLALIAGLVNFGVIPVVGARFMVYFLNLPYDVTVLGLRIPTHLLLMSLFLTLCTFMITMGGQITVLITDCVSGMFSQIFYVVVGVSLLLTFFHWQEVRGVLLDRPPGQSLVNPFDSFSAHDFNLWFVLIGIFLSTYTTMAWQNNHAFNSSAATPHESRMGYILGNWRGFAWGVMVTMLALCAFTYLARAQGAQNVQNVLNTIPDQHTREQMRVPVALSQLMPLGIKGLLCSIVLMGILSGDGIHLHSWSSIFIQDVVMPLRKKPLSTRQHLLILRLAVVGVAAWAFCFGALFPQTEYMAMWFGVTEAIYTGGAGAAIIGGLYWSRGTAAGAWAGLLTGSILSVSGIVIRQIYPNFPLNGREISLAASLMAIGIYIVISLLTCKVPHNMDKLLHRGTFAIKDDQEQEQKDAGNRISWIQRIVGINAEFTRSDRWITLGIFGWSLFWFLVFAVGSAWYLIHPWSNEIWADYWLITSLGLPFLIAIATTIWFTIGCWKDIRLFFRRLKTEPIDTKDDGSVL